MSLTCYITYLRKWSHYFKLVFTSETWKLIRILPFSSRYPFREVPLNSLESFLLCVFTDFASSHILDLCYAYHSVSLGWAFILSCLDYNKCPEWPLSFPLSTLFSIFLPMIFLKWSWLLFCVFFNWYLEVFFKSLNRCKGYIISDNIVFTFLNENAASVFKMCLIDYKYYSNDLIITSTIFLSINC